MHKGDVMRDGWDEKPLSEVCEIRPPKREAKQKIADSESVSFVPMDELGIRQKYFTASQSKPLSAVYGGYTYFADGDVLLAKITPCFQNGKLGIANNLVNGIGFGSSEFVVLRSRGGIDPEYLFHYLSQETFTESGVKVMTGAVGHKRVPKEFIEELPIPLPPLGEQKRIVAILDEAFAGIDQVVANTEKNLDNARELFESYLNQIFTQKGEGWEEKRLGEIAHFKNGLNYTKTSDGELVKIVGVKDFRNNYWVPIEGLEQVQINGGLSESYRLNRNDILTVRSNGNKQLIGRCMLVGDVEQDTSHSGFTIRIRLYDSCISPQYLTHYLKTNIVKQRLVSAGEGVNISSLNQQSLSVLSVNYPDKLIQSTIVQQIESVQRKCNKLISNYKIKLQHLADLKQSILQKAFAGELTADTVEEALA